MSDHGDDNVCQQDKLKMYFLLDLLLESSSSSEDEVEQVLKKSFKRKRPRVQNYISDVIDNYTDLEFRKNMRMSRGTCDELIKIYEESEYFKNDNTHGGKEIISGKTQILAFLWFADNHVVIRNVAELFNMSESTFHGVVTKILNFFTHLASMFIKFPRTEEELQEAADNFYEIANFPNAIGCVDGSYINIKTPAHKIKSTYVNRHDKTSLTLQGICDSKKRFIDVFTGVSGKLHDARIYKLSFIYNDIQNIENKKFHLLGDAAYPLSIHLLTPYRDYGNLTPAQRNFNLKFCATRVLIENAFGLLKGRFRQLQLIYFHSVERCAKFIISCCVLHNMCIDNEDYLELEDYVFPDEDDVPDYYAPADRDRQLGERKRNIISNYLYNENDD